MIGGQVIGDQAAGLPTLEQVRDWIDVSVTSLDDAALEQVVNSELELQAIACRIPQYAEDYPAFLVQALYRRVARQCQARGVPLGLAGLDAEFGGARVPSWDPEIERLEGPVRKWVFA